MKKIEAVVRPDKLDSVCGILQKTGYPGLMITKIEGHGKQKNLVQQWRDKEYRAGFLPKIKIEVVVKDRDLDKTVRAIREAAYTGEMGDGKIFISTIDDVVRVRTAEYGDIAV